MIFTNLKKYVYSKNCLKQWRQPPYQSLQQSQRYFRAEKVTWLWPLFAIEYAYPADRVTKRSVYRSPWKVISYSPGSGRPAILKLPSFRTIVTNHWICTTQQNCIYTGLASLSLSSTRVIVLVPTLTSASIKVISVFLVWSRGIRCAYWDNEERKQKVCFVTHSFLNKIWDYLKFQGFSVKRLW